MAKNDGGPAFPISHPTYPQGMSLRDWFAGQALAGLMAANSPTSSPNAAGAAYEIADAMLAEREREKDDA